MVITTKMTMLQESVLATTKINIKHHENKTCRRNINYRHTASEMMVIASSSIFGKTTTVMKTRRDPH